MRKLFICSALSLTFLCTSCLGSFSAFNGLKNWNQDVTANKFVNNLIFWALNIVPVYSLFMFGDLVIFNLLEFWTGSNPIAMNEGEIETQTIEKNGVRYTMIATKNQMKIRVLSGEKAGKELTLVYEPADKSWNAVQDGKSVKLSSYEDGMYIVYLPDGETVEIEPTATQEEGLALINQKVANYKDCMLASIN